MALDQVEAEHKFQIAEDAVDMAFYSFKYPEATARFVLLGVRPRRSVH